MSTKVLPKKLQKIWRTHFKIIQIFQKEYRGILEKENFAFE